MKFRDISYDAIIYLLILFLGYTVGGYLLAAYDVNRFILFGTALITLRLAQTGTASIALAIAWICLCFWGSVFFRDRAFKTQNGSTTFFNMTLPH